MLFFACFGAQARIHESTDNVYKLCMFKDFRETKMITTLRIKLARWILGRHCPCYQMGYHSMVDFQQRSADKLKECQK